MTNHFLGLDLLIALQLQQFFADSSVFSVSREKERDSSILLRKKNKGKCYTSPLLRHVSVIDEDLVLCESAVTIARTQQVRHHSRHAHWPTGRHMQGKLLFWLEEYGKMNMQVSYT